MVIPVEPSTRHAVESPGIEVLIKEARRRRWLAGVLCAVLLAAGTATCAQLRGGGRSVGAVTDGAARRVAATPCASSLTYGPLPEWARAGFQPPDLSMPHVLGARGAIVAVLWSRRDPLVESPGPGRTNKIPAAPTRSSGCRGCRRRSAPASRSRHAGLPAPPPSVRSSDGSSSVAPGRRASTCRWRGAGSSHFAGRVIAM